MISVTEPTPAALERVHVAVCNKHPILTAMTAPPAFQLPTPVKHHRYNHVSAPTLNASHRSPRCAATPPRRKAAVANDLRQALQASLLARTSRIDLVLPPGAALGTETRPKDEPLRTRVRAADRELARVVSGMFEGTGLTMRLLFPDDAALRDAEKMWGTTSFEMRSWGGKAKAKKVTKKVAMKAGFGQQTAGRATSDDPIDVYVLVGGGAAFLARGRKLAEEMGQDKLVILLNANSSADSLPVDLETFRDLSFESVYYYMPNPHPKWSGGVLFRKFPDDWVLGRISPIGTLQQLMVTPEKPSLDEIAAALGQEGRKPENQLLKKISGFMDWAGP